MSHALGGAIRRLRWLLAIGLLLAGAARAYQDVPLDVDQLTRRAVGIVEGQVLTVQSATDPDGQRISTTVLLDAQAWHKGPFPLGSFELRYPGGSDGDVTFVVLGNALQFTPGERVFLFVDPRFEEAESPLVGGEQGKFVITVDPVTGLDVIRNAHIAADKAETIAEIEAIVGPPAP